MTTNAMVALHELVPDAVLRKILALADAVQERQEYNRAERQRRIQQLREQRRIAEGFKRSRHERRAS